MIKYKLKSATNIMLSIIIIILIVGIVVMAVQVPSLTKDSYLPFAGCALLVIGIFIHLVTLKIKMYNEPFSAVSIDNENNKLILEAKNKQLIEIPYDNISGVYLTSGEVLKHIEMGHIKIIDKNGTEFPVTVSDVYDFNNNLPADIPRELDEVWLFRIK